MANLILGQGSAEPSDTNREGSLSSLSHVTSLTPLAPTPIPTAPIPIVSLAPVSAPVPSSTAPTSTRSLTTPSPSIYCSYSYRLCRRSRLHGYSYCARHILEDPTAPYKPCTYTAGKKCGRPYMKSQGRWEKKDGLCPDHQRKSYQMSRRLVEQQSMIQSGGDQVTSGSLLRALAPSYMNGGNAGAAPGGACGQQQARGGGGERAFNSLGFNRIQSPSGSAGSSQFLESSGGSWRHKGSDYEDEGEAQVDPMSMRRYIDSDTDSIDSEHEDPLKNAGVYTVEEAARITYEKMVRLQTLYKSQYKYLQRKMEESHQTYLERRKHELEKHGPIDTSKLSKDEMKDYKKLCALRRYRKPGKQEALVKRQFHEKRRLKTRSDSNSTAAGSAGPLGGVTMGGGSSTAPPYLRTAASHHPRCAHSDKKGRCGKRALPLTKHCQKHITEDSRQVLFARCVLKPKCRNVVVSYSPTTTCHLHTALPPLAVRYPVCDVASYLEKGTRDMERMQRDEAERLRVVGGADRDPCPAEPAGTEEMSEGAVGPAAPCEQIIDVGGA